MNRKMTIGMAVFAATCLLLPGALAAPWKALGTAEPDTVFDRTNGFMWQTPNHAKDLKVYFNVVPVNEETYVNPNSAETGSRVLPPGTTSFDAFYGFWIDCNKDGYIGSIETALIEYPTPLLRGDDSLCPSYQPKDTNSVFHARFHQQGYVSELVWISNGNSTPNSYDGWNSAASTPCLSKADPKTTDGGLPGRDGRVVRDRTVIDCYTGALVSPGANVWGDFGFPGNTQTREICPRGGNTNPQAPARTFHSTGGILNWVDCFAGHNAWRTANPALAAAGFGFSKQDDWNQAGHPLNQNTFGEDPESNSAVRVWDCSKPVYVATGMGYQGVGSKDDPAVQVDKGEQNGTRETYDFWVQVTDANGHLNTSVRRYDTAGDDAQDTLFRPIFNVGAGMEEAPRGPGVAGTPGATAWSIAGTVNHTAEGADNCDFTDDDGHDVYFLESQQIYEFSKDKKRVTLRFGFYEEQRNGLPPCTGCPATGAPFHGAQVYPVVRGNPLILTEGNHWFSEGVAASELGENGPTVPMLVRTDDLSPAGGIYWTFYANATSKVTGISGYVPVSAPGAYGQDWATGCGTQFKGTVKGFVCDPNQWYRGLDGKLQDGANYHPRPGNPFLYRDVDCYDGQVVKGVPVYASAALLADPAKYDGYGGVCKA